MEDEEEVGPDRVLPSADYTTDKGLILLSSISAENFSDKFSSSNFWTHYHFKTTLKSVGTYLSIADIYVGIEGI
jgi:hypothetical protein